MVLTVRNATRRPEPFRELEKFFGVPYLPTWSQPSSFAPAMDIYETPDALVIRATVPGLIEENLELTVIGDQLSVRGVVKPEPQPENEKWVWYLNERRHGTFARTLSLPVAVVADQASAQLEHGILTVTLPKAEEAKPKSIKINGK